MIKKSIQPVPHQIHFITSTPLQIIVSGVMIVAMDVHQVLIETVKSVKLASILKMVTVKIVQTSNMKTRVFKNLIIEVKPHSVTLAWKEGYL